MAGRVKRAREEYLAGEPSAERATDSLREEGRALESARYRIMTLVDTLVEELRDEYRDMTVFKVAASKPSKDENNRNDDNDMSN